MEKEREKCEPGISPIQGLGTSPMDDSPIGCLFTKIITKIPTIVINNSSETEIEKRGDWLLLGNVNDFVITLSAGEQILYAFKKLSIRCPSGFCIKSETPIPVVSTIQEDVLKGYSETLASLVDTVEQQISKPIVVEQQISKPIVVEQHISKPIVVEQHISKPIVVEQRTANMTLEKYAVKIKFSWDVYIGIVWKELMALGIYPSEIKESVRFGHTIIFNVESQVKDCAGTLEGKILCKCLIVKI